MSCDAAFPFPCPKNLQGNSTFFEHKRSYLHQLLDARLGFFFGLPDVFPLMPDILFRRTIGMDLDLPHSSTENRKPKTGNRNSTKSGWHVWMDSCGAYLLWIPTTTVTTIRRDETNADDDAEATTTGNTSIICSTYTLHSLPSLLITDKTIETAGVYCILDL